MEDAVEKKHSIRRFLMTGLIALLPILVTFFIINWIIQFVHDSAGGHLHGYLKGEFDGLWPAAPWSHLREFFTHPLFADALCVAAFVVLALIVGFLLATFIGRRLFRAAEDRLARLPVIKTIYPAIKQVTDFFFARGQMRYSRVVALEYPRKGVYTMAFVTGEGLKTISDRHGRRCINIFVPTSPTPITGYVVFVPEDELIPLAISVEEAVRLLVSGGVVIPPRLLNPVDPAEQDAQGESR